MKTVAGSYAAMEVSVDGDLARWKSRLPDAEVDSACPAPHEEGGLPSGWSIWSTYANFFDDVDRLLVRRAAGDWLLVWHSRTDEDTTVPTIGSTLVELYNENAIDRTYGSPHAATARIDAWLRKVILRLYDLSDPTEAAEATLVALGADITVCPRAAV